MNINFMSLKTVLLNLLLLSSCCICLADTEQQLQQAKGLYETGEYQQAEQVYQSILEQYGGTAYAFEAQKALAISYIASGKNMQAKAAVEALKVNFSDNVHIQEAAYGIAQQYLHFQKYKEAAQLYKYVVDKDPKGEYAILAQTDLAISNIFLRDGQAAEAAVEKLLTDYSGDERIAEAVYYVAHHYRGFQRYEKANRLYQRIINNWPQSKHAKWAQLALAMSDVIASNAKADDTAIENLISRFSGDANINITKAVHDIAQQYRWLEKFDKARELYQYVLAHGPEDKYAIWSQMGLVISNVRLGDMKAAEAEIGKLLSKYSSSKYIASVIYDIAQQCCWADRYDKARPYYQYVVDHRPQSEHARWSRMGLAALDILPLIEVGNQTKTQAAIDSLIADFSDCPYLSDAISVIVAGYHNRITAVEQPANEDYRNLIQVWEKATGILPNFSFRYPDSYFSIADCYHGVGEYNKAIQCYNTVLDNWPGHQYAWHAQFMVGLCYEGLKDTGAVEKSAADEQTRAAYERVIQKYPNCPAAEYARAWISRYNSK
jgi:tetratricopeptide (TPR) repeat protein